MSAHSFKCRKCLKLRPVSERIKLWDGHAYCASCVRAFSPRLAEYAAAHNRWEDCAPWDHRSIWRKALRTELLLFLIIAGSVSCLAFVEWGATGIPLGIAFAVLACAIHILVSLPRIIGWKQRTPPSVAIENGTVSTSCHRRKKDIRFNYPLHEMRWHIGKPRHDLFLCLNHLYPFMPRQPVVILVARQKLCGMEFDVPWLRMGIASGWNNETRQVLIDFLTFCGVPRG